MIDSQLVGTSVLFIESRIRASWLMCQVILHSPLLSSSFYVICTLIIYYVYFYSGWYCVWKQCAQWLALWILNKVPPPPPPPPPIPNPSPLCAAWQPSRMWQVEVFQAERGVTLPLPMQNWFWLVTQCQTHKMCYSSVDRPGEQRAGPSPTLMPSPMAADATWRPRSLQPARRCRRAPAGSPEPMSMSCTERAFSAGRQAACRPLLSPFLGGTV